MAEADATRRVQIRRVEGEGALPVEEDWLAVEEPLEIRIGFGPRARRAAESISITMRTPGEDIPLALGFLRTEGVLRALADVEDARHCGPGAPAPTNVVRVELTPEVKVDMGRLSRHVYTTSSCGICGKASLEAVRAQGLPPLSPGPRFDAARIHGLPEVLRGAQETFDRTGGLHAAALIGEGGALLALEEDVGRHNAVDKAIGRALMTGLDLGRTWMMVSGRAGFELVQKALVVGIPAMAAVGAPTSLAVELAQAQGMTLLGFVRRGRFNIYSGPERVQTAPLGGEDGAHQA